MLAMLSVFSLKQRYSAEIFELAYARSPLASQTMPLLIENLVRRDGAKLKGSKRKVMKKSGEPAGKKQRQPWSGS